MKNFLALAVLLCTTLLHAQVTKLKGEISDGKEKLPGVSIQIKGTSSGTISGMNGDFSLDVKRGDILLFSYVGYQTQAITYKGETNLKVTLRESIKELTEMVVVGYAKQTKATLTGAVSSIQSDALIKRNVASLSTALQGKMSGVTVQQNSGQPGEDGGTINVRGLGSMNSSSAPLVLVDGIESDINQVDMSIVESISVLKDAASASIYGSRSSNGVILITTKRGAEGKVNVTYNGYISMQRPTNMPEVVNAATLLRGRLDAKDNAGITVSPSERQQTLSLIEEYNTYQADNWNRYDTDWKAATMKDQSFMQSHSVTVNGGSKVIQYFTSGSYLYQDGLIPNNNFKRTNIRANADAKITSWAKFSMETNLRQSVNLTPTVSSPKSIINKSLYMDPTLSAAVELDGNWGYGKNGDNPAAQANAGGTTTNTSSEILGSGTLTITPLKDWDIIGQYSRKITSKRDRAITTPYQVSLKGANLGQYPSDDGLTEGFSETIYNFYRIQSSYSKSMNKFFIKGMVGFQAEDNTNSSFSGSKRGFDLGKYYLGAGDGSTASALGGAYSWALASFYGRINANYDEKYLLEVNGRYDGSSRFTEKNRWGFFPSVSAGWTISREEFMEGANEVVNLLKLRASYGVLGNQAIGSYYPYSAIVETGYGYWFDKNIYPGVAETTMSNPDIRWESSKQFDVGIDATLWDGKLSLIADYYQKNIFDMLYQLPQPYFLGMQPEYQNLGEMSNKGWEIALGHKNKIGEFSYDIMLTLSDNRNEVVNVYGYNSPDKTITEGYPFKGIWGFKTDGYYRDWDDVAASPKYQKNVRPGYVKYVKIAEGTNTDPMVIDNNDRTYLGDPFPHYTYGANINAQWKNFDMTLFIQGVGQRSTYMSGIGLIPFYNGANLFTHQMDYWTPENMDAAYPILIPSDNAGVNFQKSDKWVKEGRYARLKNVVLGYSLPGSVCQKLKIASLRFYLSGQNLLTISNFYKGYDPEAQYGGNQGGEFYPIMQTFTFGVDFKF